MSVKKEGWEAEDKKRERLNKRGSKANDRINSKLMKGMRVRRKEGWEAEEGMRGLMIVGMKGYASRDERLKKEWVFKWYKGWKAEEGISVQMI